MRKLCHLLLSCAAAWCINCSVSAQSIDTAFGSITLPQSAEISAAVAAVENSALDDEQKQQRLQYLNEADEIIAKFNQVNADLTAFAATRANAAADLSALEQELYQTRQRYGSSPEQIDAGAEDLSEQLEAAGAELQETQQALAAANAQFASLQTLPSRAQSNISQNNSRIDEISSRLNAATTAAPDDLELRLLAVEHYTLGLENSLLLDQLTLQNTLQDIATYKIHINTIKSNYLTDYIRLLQTAVSLRNIQNLHYGASGADSGGHNANLQQTIDQNQQITTYIDQQLQDNLRLGQELQQVQNAFNTVTQIEATLSEQISSVGGSLFLSRLLNRQQSEIPEIKLSFNLDELIPNLNVWLYDLRSSRDELFDITSYCDALTAKYPQLAESRTELEDLIRRQRSLLDNLHQSMSEGLTQAISLKLKYAELEQATARVNAVINEHLFWMRSNLPLGREFALSFAQRLNRQLLGIAERMSMPEFWERTLHTVTLFFVPLVLILALTLICRPFLRRRDNQLAMRLNKTSDAHWVTAAALLVRLGLSLPKIALLSALGSLIVFLILDDMEQQLSVIRMLLLHISVFVFYLEILKPNSVMQRYFCMPPPVIDKLRTIIDKLWMAIVPVLLIANTRELDTADISGDIMGYCLMLLCCGYITYIAVRFLLQEFAEKELSFMAWVRGLLMILIPISLFIMLALGYYYTVIKLVNRIAFSLYTCMFYLLISSIIRRELFVTENRIVRQMKLYQSPQTPVQGKASGAERSVSNPRRERQRQIDELRLELINSKAFKLIDGVLICLTVVILYRQWSDLAGVINYLDTVYLWKHETMINGVISLNQSLTLTNVIIALLIIALTMLLNHNLPTLVERLFLLAPTQRRKSTSYTIRILSSYVIITAGIVLTAGSLGISWDQLQWLVAALSVGLGFGLQEIFANFVSGIIILFERQLRVGDIITLSDLSGTVSKIRIRATTIVSFDNKEVLIPNREFITTALTNWSLSNTVTKVEFLIGIGYDADVRKAKAILNQIVRSCTYLAPEQPHLIYVCGLQDNCVSIMCEVYVKEIGSRKLTTDYLSTEVLRRFAEAGITIPYQRSEVLLKNLDNGRSLKIG